MFKVNDGNTKLGKSIKVINLPAGLTCRTDAPCRGICYASKGLFRFPVVRRCYSKNLNSYLIDPKKTEEEIISQLKAAKYCRVHASGDIIDGAYFTMLMRIAGKLPSVQFMMFTKKYEIVNGYVDMRGFIPKNFSIIFSLWDMYPCNNPHNFPTSQVKLEKGNVEPIKTGLLCPGKCDTCYRCWTLKRGENVIFKQH